MKVARSVWSGGKTVRSYLSLQLVERLKLAIIMTNLSSLVIGLDCSTSACKAVVWDCRGNAIAKGYSSLSLITP